MPFISFASRPALHQRATVAALPRHRALKALHGAIRLTVARVMCRVPCAVGNVPGPAATLSLSGVGLTYVPHTVGAVTQLQVPLLLLLRRWRVPRSVRLWPRTKHFDPPPPPPPSLSSFSVSLLLRDGRALIWGSTS